MKNIFLCSLIGIFCLSSFYNLFSQNENNTQKTINEYEYQVINYQKANNKVELARCQAKLGYLYWEINNTDKAIESFQSAIKANEDIGNQNAIRTICTNIGMINYDKENYEEALTYFRKSLRINQKVNKRNEIAADLINIANSLQSLKKYEESNTNILQALPIFQEIEDIKSLKNGYSSLSENYEKLGKNDKAKEYFELASALNKHLQKEELKKFESRTKQAEALSSEKNKELQSTMDTLKEVIQLTREKQMEIELINKEQELNELRHQSIESEFLKKEANRKNVLKIMSLILFLIIIFFILIFWQLREKKKANRLLEQSYHQIAEQNKEIEIQRDLANHQKKKITDSILYAQRIQKAVMPPTSQLEKIYPENFIMLKPRDIVSGDFYWIAQKENVLIIAAADCTGHGVPGAFMSMLGVAFLNEIVSKMTVNKHIQSLHANDILNQLRDNLISSLHQTGRTNEAKDGMDISLCIIDTERYKMQYAGAHNPVYIIRNNELTHLEADKMPIGIYRDIIQPFTNKEFDLKVGDMVYMFSDGYYDQFGGPKGMKFFSANFRKLLIEINQLPVAEQKERLIQNITDWRGDQEQIDDMLVIGFKITSVIKHITSTHENVWPNKRVLIAEDMDLNYFLLVEALKPTKVQVFRAHNGQEAFDFCKSHEVDLVLMDVRMPVMDGIEATKLIRNINKDIPIVAQTAQSEPGDKETLLKAGCNDYISKPIDLKTFLFTINKYLAKD